MLTTNYDMRGTILDSKFVPYVIKQYENRKIGFVGINLNPKGMISDENCVGIKYIDGVKAANATAWHLKHNERVDAVVALTHIGYAGEVLSDTLLAKNSEDIDVIIGGHSHDVIDSQSVKSNALISRITNASGREVLVAQAGKAGRYVGEIVINLDDMSTSSRLITVDSRFDKNADQSLASIIKPYRHGVDSIMSIKIAKSAIKLDNAQPELQNFISDFVEQVGESVVGGNVDLAIMNKGGIRSSLPKGTITTGMIITMMPFYNKVVVMDIKGSDLRDAFNVMAKRDGDCVSESVEIIYDNETDICETIKINGKLLNDDKKYRIATIDYLAKGGDYMTPLKKGEIVGVSDNWLYDDMIYYLKDGNYKGKTLNPSKKKRMHVK